MSKHIWEPKRRKPFLTLAILVAIGVSVLAAGTPGGDSSWSFTPSREQLAALNGISEDSLRGHLSFLASDLLQGRSTPSFGQDIAAQYIAAQFIRAGLEAPANDGYFQTVSALAAKPNPAGFRLRFVVGGKPIEIPYNHFSMNSIRGLDLDAPLIPISFGSNLLPSNLAGKIAICKMPPVPGTPSTSEESASGRRDLVERLGDAKASALVFYAGGTRETRYFSTTDLMWPGRGNHSEGKIPVITINDDAIVQPLESMRRERTWGVLSLHLANPEEKRHAVRNVSGLLRGSDPVLQNSYILVTAHYDGTGPPLDASGDAVWNAANDDGSGTVSVLEIASAIASLRERPRRSIAFITFFGEEKGLLGSKYYAQHPLLPIERTVAAINLEQLGRTDSAAGDQTNRAALTGYYYSDLWRVFEDAGRHLGVAVVNAGADSDDYFSRSDNAPLAEAGILAHTLCVAFEFSDYHGAGDKWEKINFPNLQRIDRMIALAILNLAQSDLSPKWNGNNDRVLAYLRAWQRHHAE